MKNPLITSLFALVLSLTFVLPVVHGEVGVFAAVANPPLKLREIIITGIAECKEATPAGDRNAFRICLRTKIATILKERKSLSPIPPPLPTVPEPPFQLNERHKADMFAACLTKNKAVFYGAEWCPHCQTQKALFGESFAEIDYVECTEQQVVCQQAKIEGYPTWKIGDKTLVGTRSLVELGEAAGCLVPELGAPVSTKKPAERGEMCGGIGGAICAEGLQCAYQAKYPDASGTCEEIPESTEE